MNPQALEFAGACMGIMQGFLKCLIDGVLGACAGGGYLYLSGVGCEGPQGRYSQTLFAYELQSISPTSLTGYRCRFRDYIRDYTELHLHDHP